MATFPQRSELYWIPLEFEEAGEGGLKKDCVAKGDEIQLIDPIEILWRRGRLGRFSADQMNRVITAVRHALRDPSLGQELPSASR